MSQQNEIFLQAMTAWLESKGYGIGVQGRDVNATKEKWAIRIGLTLMKLGIHALGGKIPAGQRFHMVNSHMTAEKLTEALTPFWPLFDLVGWSLGPMPVGNSLFLVNFADAMTTGEIMKRYEQIFELSPAVANLGIKVQHRHAGIVAHLFLAYFDERIYNEHFRTLESRGSDWKFWSRLFVRTGFLNIPRRTVKWTKAPGLTLGFPKPPPLTDADLGQIYGGATAAENKNKSG